MMGDNDVLLARSHLVLHQQARQAALAQQRVGMVRTQALALLLDDLLRIRTH